MGESASKGLSSYHKGLLGMLVAITFFEGYDFLIISLVLPFVSRDFGISTSGAGLAVSVISIGTILAFMVISLADRFGRRPVFIITIFLYALFSGLTAFTKTIELFVACQFLARVFLTAEWALASIIIAEEFPVSHRGLGIAAVQCAAAVGAVGAALLLPVASKLGLDWRALYLFGTAPVLLAIVAGRRLRETALWERKKDSGTNFFKVMAHPYRRDMITVMFIWLFTYLNYTAAQTFWTYFAVNERGWDEYQVSRAVATAYLIGISGFLAAGRCMDRFGRRTTAYLFFILGSMCTAWAFNASGPWMYVSLTALTFFIGAYLPISSAFTTELFPTELRATAMAWGNNLFGRVGMVLAPGLAGFMAAPAGGIGNAVTIIGAAPLISVVLIYFLLRETKDVNLDFSCNK